MASVLILSEQGDGIPIALRLKDEGHIVKIFFKDQKVRNGFTGYSNPSKVGNPRIMLDQYDLVLSDMVGSGTLVDELVEKGKLALGGGAFNDSMELDRNYGEKVMRSLTDVKIPESMAISTTQRLMEYLDEVSYPVVIKPSGNMSTTLTLVSNDKKNRALKSFAVDNEYLTPCIVQRRVDGVEVSTEGWFNKGWITFNHTLELKRLMEHNKGPNTGCMGNVVWTTEGDRLTKLLLNPLTPLLERVKYVGPLDVNCIVDEEDVYYLEVTARFGYDAIQALTELLRMSLFDFLYYNASRVGRAPTYHEGYGIAVRLSVPPYPNKKEMDRWKGVQVIDIPGEARRHVMLSDVMMVDGVEVLSGVDGVIGCVTARGQTVREAQRRAYRTIENIVLSEDVQYRRDVGMNAMHDMELLKEWGWIDNE